MYGLMVQFGNWEEKPDESFNHYKIPLSMSKHTKAIFKMKIEKKQDWKPFSLQDDEKIDTLYFYWQFLIIPKFLLDGQP